MHSLFTVSHDRLLVEEVYGCIAPVPVALHRWIPVASCCYGDATCMCAKYMCDLIHTVICTGCSGSATPATRYPVRILNKGSNMSASDPCSPRADARPT
eukprot:jgi/Chrzof1/12056/Cz06g19210.t1